MLPYPDHALLSGRFGVRRWTERDLDCIERASQDSRITAGTTVPANYSRREGIAFIRRQWSRAEEGAGVSQAIIDAHTDQAIGLVIVIRRPQRHVAGLGYWVIPEARGQGAATNAIMLVKDWAFPALELRRLEAWVEPDNIGSQVALAKAGFEREGRLRNFFNSDAGSTDAIVFSALP